MTPVREPILSPVPIKELRPTQITVGMREVHLKREHWRKQNAKKREKFFAQHLIPVILGPNKRNYIIDHHHLALALHEEGVKELFVTVITDLSKLDQDAFWSVIDMRGLMFPFDDEGRRRSHKDIPKSVTELIDDPFRSLAGELRRAGGFAKETTPFNESIWADFLRRRISRKSVDEDFDRALKKAIKLSQCKDADFLPGWCGPEPE